MFLERNGEAIFFKKFATLFFVFSLITLIMQFIQLTYTVYGVAEIRFKGYAAVEGTLDLPNYFGTVGFRLLNHPISVSSY